MTDQNTGTVSAAEYGAAMLYDQMSDRIAGLPDDWGIAMMAARLYCKRVSLDVFLCQLVTEGVPKVASRCRAEMMVRHEFFVDMLQRHPPEDHADIEKAAEELAADLATFDSVDTTMRLLRFLDRLQRRELALHPIATTQQ